MKEYKTHSYEETVKLGERVAKSLPKGSVVAFLGGLGMGKTLSQPDLPKDLALTLMFPHRPLQFAILISRGKYKHHFDMYRVDGWDDLYSTGFFDFLETDAYMAIEWSENVYGKLCLMIR